MVVDFSITLTPDADDDNGIATSQTPAAGGEQALTLTSSTVTLDVARQVLITTAADETGRTFTITGTDRYGKVISEELTGVNNSTVGTAKDFKTVTEVLVDDNTAGAIIVGTSEVVRSEWIPVKDQFGGSIGFGVYVSGLTYTVEHTFNRADDDPPVVFPHSSVANKTVNADGAYIAPINAMRLKVTAGSDGTNTVTLRGIMAKA